MSRKRMVVLGLAALLSSAGMLAEPASAQSPGPDPGWVPGQPYLVTITGPAGSPLLVVHSGRLPLQGEPRVRLVLPDLGDSGLTYALTTGTIAEWHRKQGIDSSSPDTLQKPQYVVGRVHVEFVHAPVDPSVGSPPDGVLHGSSSADEHTLGSGADGSNAAGTGTLAATVEPGDDGNPTSGGASRPAKKLKQTPYGDDLHREPPEIGPGVIDQPAGSILFFTEPQLQPGGILGGGGVVILLIGDQGLGFEDPESN